MILHTNKKNDDKQYPKAELLSLAIKKSSRGSGAAKILFDKLSYYFDKKGLKDFKIVVGNDLHLAHKFYKKMGAVEIGTVDVHKNENSIIYQVIL